MSDAIGLSFEKISRYDRPGEPCTVAVPLPAGELPTAGGAYDPVAVTGPAGAVPTQSRVTASWPDGSVKWLLVHFLADLPGGESARFQLELGKAPPGPESPVEVRNDGGALSLTTAGFAATLAQPGGSGLIESLSLGEMRLEGEAVSGPVVTAGGKAFTAAVDAPGWELVESGPVRAVARCRGRHLAEDGASLLDLEARLHMTAGKPWARLDYRIINREDEDEIAIESVTMSLQPGGSDPAGIRTALATSNYRSNIRRSDSGEALEFTIDDQFLLYNANEQIPEVLYGAFWADWTDPDAGGVAVSMHQAYQNYPKRLAVSGDRLDADIVPEGPVGRGGLKMLKGMAKTHSISIHLHGPEATPEELAVRSLQFEMPDRPVVDAVAWRRASVVEDVFIDEPVGAVERFLVDLADRRVRAYGMLHWGDGPDMSYTEQGRGSGELVWTNGEYDLAHAAWLMYCRAGERRYLDYMLVAARHWMDVDVCHHSDDPFRMDGQVVHSARHVSAGVTPSHEWVQGLLDYWHCTGDETALETALAIGRNVLRHLEGKPHLRQAAGAAARETGWALRTFTGLYVETGDSTWMEQAGLIVDQFDAWRSEHGAWLAPYTDHTLARVPFMIAIAAGSLMRYWRVRSEDRVASMIVNSMDDLIEHCLMPDGRFYYKELPSLRQRAAGLYVLESLAYAHEITGDRRYIDAGMITFELAVARTASGNVVGRKYVADDAVVWETGASPKAFASSLLPAVSFYREALKAGALR